MRFIPVLAATLALLGATPAPAQQLPGTTRQLALSGATHAFANGTAAVASNPAGMSLVYQYMIEGNYQYWRGATEHQTTVSLVDSSTNHAFAIGGAYTFHRGQLGSSTGAPASLHNALVAASTGFQAGAVGLYLGGEYKYLNAAVGTLHDATFGALVSIQQMVNVGVVGHNLFSPRKGLTPRALTTGVSVGQESFIVAFDTTFDFDTRPEMSMIYAVGAEYFIAGAASLRAGYRYDKPAGGRHSLSAGVGYIYKFFGVEVGFEQNPKVGRDDRFVGSVVFFIP
jgi:hypothetical protein